MKNATSAAQFRRAPQEAPPRSGPIAPGWHTALMVILVLGPLIQARIAARLNPGAALQAPPAIPFYLTGALVLFIFLAFTWWGLRLRGHTLSRLVGGRWSNWKQVAGDIGLAVLFWALWYAALSALKLGLRAAGITNSQASGMIFPTTALQVGLFVFNSVLSGLVEELVFRGYLMTQFTAWTRSATLGVILQAALFGAAHGFYLGTRQVLLIFASGILIGAFALWRKNLRPAMAFHAWADIFGAVIVRGLPFQ
ncbi:MAG TPA: type II CAAX endopeptidase family protein [Terriglobales bacterium]|nr:type II CAAX endopeptidase family protein [Terriglobales bacterium]